MATVHNAFGAEALHHVATFTGIGARHLQENSNQISQRRSQSSGFRSNVSSRRMRWQHLNLDGYPDLSMVSRRRELYSRIYVQNGYLCRKRFVNPRTLI